MDLADLNRSVTRAIVRAEALPPNTWDAQRAFREVADLEEEIATIVGARTAAGEIARLGAITAALSAGEPLHALQLGERYLAHGLSEGSRTKLTELLAEADAEIVRDAKSAPNVEPVRYSLHATES
jgi:hypothetical protein